MIETNKTFFIATLFGAGRSPRRSYRESEFSSAGGYHTHIGINSIGVATNTDAATAYRYHRGPKRLMSLDRAPSDFGGAPSGVG
jgi:catechol-2,3-dioxygenase